MTLIKFIETGDELEFDLRNKRDDADKISVSLTEKAGRKAVLRITADKSIKVRHFRQQTVERG